MRNQPPRSDGAVIRALDGHREAESGGPLLLESPGEREALIAGFRRNVPSDPAIEPRLAAVLADVVGHPGSFVRAQVAYDVGWFAGIERSAAADLAVALEYFHTASLLFDDLPMMDDARDRRGRPCPHTVWGEPAAVLAALALVNRAYEMLWGVLADRPAERSRRAARMVGRCLGVGGLLSGQSWDLQFDPREASEQQVLDVALSKTVPLIRLTVELPALVGGADDRTLALFGRLARGWGLSYQILDDCKDALLGPADTGKSTARDRALGRPNLLHRVGPRRARSRLAELEARSRELVDRLTGDGRWPSLRRLQRLLEAERSKIDPFLASTATTPGVPEAAAC